MWLGSGTEACPTNGSDGSVGGAGSNAGEKGLTKSNIPSNFFTGSAGKPGLGGCGQGGAAGGPPGGLAKAWNVKKCTWYNSCSEST